MSPWKPREKEMTREEAIAQAKQDLAPYWFGSTPLVAPIFAGGRWQAFPIDPAFEKQNWLVMIKDPTDPTAMIDMPLLLEFQRRYGDYGLSILYVQQPHYSYLREREYLENLFRRGKLPFVSVIDIDARMAQAFEAPGPPYGATTRAVLLSQRQIEMQRDGQDWYQEIEAAIQLLLRRKDPGLPLPPLTATVDTRHREVERIDFGRTAKPVNPALAYELSGVWWTEGDRIVTSDPGAFLKVKAPSPRFALFAQSISKVSNIARIGIDLGGAPAPASMAGPDLRIDDDGGVVVRLDEPRLYQVIDEIPPSLRDITLRFPNADRAAIAIYGLCFWD